MRFLEVYHDKAYGKEFLPELVCRELIRIDSIQHVYIVLDEQKAICIEYKNRNGEDFEMFETFDSKEHCHRRFGELSKILCNEGR